jgi:hypothetical protein
MGMLSSNSQDAICKASNITDEALVQIRIVQSFIGKERLQHAYSVAVVAVVACRYGSFGRSSIGRNRARIIGLLCGGGVGDQPSKRLRKGSWVGRHRL